MKKNAMTACAAGLALGLAGNLTFAASRDIVVVATNDLG